MKQVLTLKSGSKLELDYTSWNNTMKLVRAIANSIKTRFSDFSLDNKAIASLKGLTQDKINDLLNNPDVLFKVLSVFCELIENDNFLNALYDCADHSLLNEERINKNTFEDVELRKDFIETMFSIAKFTLSVFF